MRATKTILLAACLAFVASPALAQDGSKKKKKKTLSPYVEMDKGNKYASWGNTGGFKRASKHYKNVITADPTGFPYAYLNLGEVSKGLKRCQVAVLAYHGFIAVADPADTDSIKQAKQGIRECVLSDWPRLSVASTPEDGRLIFVDGFLLGNGKNVETIVVAPGDYEVTVKATDHVTLSESVKVSRGDGKALVERSFELEKQTFFGKVRVDVSFEGEPVPGAKVTLEPKVLDKTNPSAETFATVSPMKEDQKLATGKYFLKVEAEGYQPWIRNIKVSRDSVQTVDVRLSETAAISIP